MGKFILKSEYKPIVDQKNAIRKLVYGIKSGVNQQVLLGVTGSGKTFTMANIIERLKMPTLIISHNKTLAAQLYQEFRDYFPDNAVSYFVSYYDYYQPESYLPATDTYIEKDSAINEFIDKLRLAATSNLLTRKDNIVIASVSCIYNIGSPKEYGNFIFEFKKGMNVQREEIINRLIDLQYERGDFGFHRGTFRVRGNVIDIYPSYMDDGIRIVIEGNYIVEVTKIDPVSGEVENKKGNINSFILYPAKHFITDPNKNINTFKKIMSDMERQVKYFMNLGKVVEAERIKKRVIYDLEIIKEVGYVKGIENYSRYFDGRKPGDAPYTLLDYFKEPFDKKWLVFIDESHITFPQIRGMYLGDSSRKKTLIDYGFRLPAAIDNRPLKFDEFLRRIPNFIASSATPGDWELSMAKDAFKNFNNEAPRSDDQGILSSRFGAKSSEAKHSSLCLLRRSSHFGYEGRASTILRSWYFAKEDKNQGKNIISENFVVEQLLRPTGIPDPKISIRPVESEVSDVIKEIKTRAKKKQRVLVTTLTKKQAEDLSDYLGKVDIKVHFLHSDVKTLERSDILDDLRKGLYDCIVGVNLLREGLDLPEVSLVAILDADKEGFLRSRVSLIQTMGRAARHVEGEVILYADEITNSMKQAISEVKRRRKYQINMNKKFGIRPRSINKPIRNKLIDTSYIQGIESQMWLKDTTYQSLKNIDNNALTPIDRKKLLVTLRREMKIAAQDLNFELAAKIRDKVFELRSV